jgi:CheY-like chemotaxis protein
MGFMRPRILLVDDDIGFRKRVRNLLEENLPNCDFMEANDGKEAFELVQEKRFDVVVTDYDMLPESGEYLVHNMRRIGLRVTPVILMSSVHLSQEYTKIEFDSFVDKTDVERSLLQEIKWFLRRNPINTISTHHQGSTKP